MTSFQRKTGLGKGLSALLDDNRTVNFSKNEELTEAVSPTVGSISQIKLTEIETNPFQPRTAFDQVSLNELCESIKVQGLIQPITVRKNGDKYQLITGERRLRASKLAGLEEIPAYIRTADNQQMLEIGLIENIQREDLNAIEIALSFQQMIDECNLKPEQLGDRVGKNRTTVANYLRLLKLPPIIQAAIRDGKISMGHARALINVEESEKQLFIYQEIIDKGLSVRKVEDLARSINHIQVKPKALMAAPEIECQKLEKDLESKFATKVKLKVGINGKGTIQIPFVNTDDLNRILALLDW